LIGDQPHAKVYLLEKNLVSWKNKKLSVVSRFSVKSEYRAMTDLTCDLVWVKDLLSKLDFTLKSPMRIYCDNQGAIHIIENSVFHERI